MKRQLKPNTKLPAYNLQEILVVLVIIGILLLLALPSLMKYVTKAKSTEAQLQLKAIYNDQTMYRYMYSKYAIDLTEIDYELQSTVEQGGTSNYNYEIISANNGSFKARATAVTDFDGDGVFNVWEIDQNGAPKEIVKD